MRRTESAQWICSVLKGECPFRTSIPPWRYTDHTQKIHIHIDTYTHSHTHTHTHTHTYTHTYTTSLPFCTVPYAVSSGREFRMESVYVFGSDGFLRWVTRIMKPSMSLQRSLSSCDDNQVLDSNLEERSQKSPQFPPFSISWFSEQS